MARDFKADQVRVSSIIATRSVAGEPKILVYDASAASNFTGDSNINFANIGSDVFLYVHGSPNTANTADSFGTTLFGGDVVISGSLYAEKMVVEVDGATEGDLYVSGSIITNKSDAAPFDPTLRISGIDAAKTDIDVSPDIALKGDAGVKQAIAFKYDPSGNGSAESLIYQDSGKLHLSASDSISFHAGNPDPDALTGFTFRTENSDSGFVRFLEPKDDGGGAEQIPANHIADGAGTDSNFFVKGTPNTRGTANRGTAVFGGDVVVSGSLSDADGNPITGGSSGSFNVVDYNGANPTGLKAFVTTASVSFAGPKDGGDNDWGLGANTAAAITTAADDVGTDLYFYVHGEPGARGTAESKSSSAFGGDLIVTGAFHLGVDENAQRTHTVTGSVEINAGTAKSVSLKDGSNVSNDVSLAVALSRAANEGIGFGVFGSGNSVSSDAAIWKKDDSGVKTLFISSSQKSVFQTGAGTRAEASILINVTDFGAWESHIEDDANNNNPLATISITDSDGNSENFTFGVSAGVNVIDIDGLVDLPAVRDKVIETINANSTLNVTAASAGAGTATEQTIIITQDKPGVSGNKAGGNGDIVFSNDPGTDGNGTGSSLSTTSEFEGGTDIDSLSFYAGDYGSVRFFSNNTPGLDTNFYVEGTPGRKENGSLNSGRPGVVTLRGDEFVSGSIYSEKKVKLVAADSEITFSPIVNGNPVWSSISMGINSNGDSLNLINSGSSTIKMQGVNSQARLGNGNVESKVFNFIEAQGNGRENNRRVDILKRDPEVDVNVTQANNQATDAPTVPIVTINAENNWAPNSHVETSVFIGGTPNTIGTNNRGLTKFGGDAVITGRVSISPDEVATGDILKVGGIQGSSLTYNGTDLIVGAPDQMVAGSGLEVNANNNGVGNNPANRRFFKVDKATGTSTFRGNINQELGTAIFNSSKDQGGDFRISTQNRDSALVFDAGTDQAAILVRNAGAVDASTSYFDGDNANAYTTIPGDVSIYFDGIAGAKANVLNNQNHADATAKGIATFRGDVVVSGTIYDGAGNEIGSSANGGTIGTPTDTTYTDGLFPFTAQTTIADAIDDINELLVALAPSPAPNVNEIDRTQIAGGQEGVAAKVAFISDSPVGYFGVSALDVDETFNGQQALLERNGLYGLNVTGNKGTIRLGVLTSRFTITGRINDSAQADDYNNGAIVNYPDKSFGNGDKGILKLFVNNHNTPVRELDLSTFNGNTLPAAGSSFNDHSNNGRDANIADNHSFMLSAATAGKTASGTDFTFFKHRTGFFEVKGAAQRPGQNFVKVVHTVGGVDRVTNFIEWVLDEDGANAPLQTGATTITVTDHGDPKPLSGITYDSETTFQFQTTIENYYKHVFTNETITVNKPSSAHNAIQQSLTPNTDGVQGKISNLSAQEDHNTSITVTATFKSNGDTINDKFNGDQRTVNANISVPHVAKANLTNAGAFGGTGRLLVHNFTATSTAVNEEFNDEVFRVPDANYDNQGEVHNAGNLTANWDSSESLVGDGVGDNAGHNTGLMLFNGTLISPKKASLGGNHTSGDFRSNTDGGSYFGLDSNNADFIRTGQPDYSGATGTRTFYRAFQNNSGSPVFDGIISINGIGTVIGTNNLGANSNLKVSIKAPGSTNWFDLSKQFVLGSTNDGDGGNAQPIAGLDFQMSIPQPGISHFFTFGDVSLANGDYLIVKIEADSEWTGELRDIFVTANGKGNNNHTQLDNRTLTSLGNGSGFGVTAKLSFGVDNTITNDLGTQYVNTDNDAMGAAGVPFNGVYGVEVFNNMPDQSEKYGIFNNSTDSITLILNNDASTPDASSFPVDSFANAKQGTLRIELNEQEVGPAGGHDLTVDSAIDDDDVNTGIHLILSAPQNPKGGVVPDFTRFYRTGTIEINRSAWRPGRNNIKITHDMPNGTDPVTNFLEWIYDDDTNAVSWFQNHCEFSDFDTPDPNGDGDDRYTYLSGVKYFNEQPQADVKVRALHAYSNVYSNNSDAIKFTVSNGSISTIEFNAEAGAVQNTIVNDDKAPLPALRTQDDANNAITDPQDKDLYVTGSVTVTNWESILGSGNTFSNGILAGAGSTLPKSISCIANIHHPFNNQGLNLGFTSTAQIDVEGNSNARFLAHGTFGSGNSNDNTIEEFSNEARRLHSDGMTSIDTKTVADIGAKTWSSNQSLDGDGTGGNAGHNDGLMVYNKHLVSPKSSLLPQNGKFTSIYEDPGGAGIIGPKNNVDYSAITGERTFYRKFANPGASDFPSLKIELSGDATLVSPNTNGPGSGALGANKNIHVFVAIPKKDAGSNGLDWRDIATSPSTNTDPGGFAPGALSGNLPQGLGEVGFAFSGGLVVSGNGGELLVKIVAAAEWTGHLSEIKIIWETV